MRRTLYIAIILVLLIALPCFAQKKVTVDPNGPRTSGADEAAAVATPAPVADRYDPALDSDKRMARSVSYECSHLRLSTVAAALSQSTGVSIMCGTSKGDWRVRDIPVTLCAKDVALGVLLRGIARATHNVLRAEKPGQVTTYRIYQDPRLTKQFKSFEGAAVEYRKALLSEAWDSMVGLRSIPTAELKPIGSDSVIGMQRLDAMQKLSDVMAALGPDYKQRVMDGEPVTVAPKDLTDKAKTALMTALGAFDRLRLSYDSRVASRSPNSRTVPLTDGELANVRLKIYVPTSIDRQALLYADISSPLGLGQPLDVNLFQRVTTHKGAEPIKAPPPEQPQITEDTQCDVDVPEVASSIPDLKTKVDLDDLAATKDMTYAAALVEIAKRAGFSAVVEDWDYFKQNVNTPQRLLRKGVQVDEALRNYGRYTLRADARDKLIVGFDKLWASKHRVLAPASAVDSLIDKMKGAGADLEDVLPLVSFTKDQFREWIEESRDLSIVMRHSVQPGDPLWQFYASLTAQDRTQAATSEGLILSAIEPGMLSDVIKECRNFRDKTNRGDKLSYPTIPDAQDLAQLVLHLRVQTSKFYPSSGTVSSAAPGKAIPRGLDTVYVYGVDIVGIANTKQQTHASTGQIYGLPFYSSGREAQLLKELSTPPDVKAK